jgi:hypothetical protein
VTGDGSLNTIPSPPASIARTPQPPYYAVIFTSQRTDGDRVESVKVATFGFKYRRIRNEASDNICSNRANVIPGRWAEVRAPNEDELKKTLVLPIPLTEASAKVRSGSPIDEEVDYTLPVWAGELPFRLVTGVPISDPRLERRLQAPTYIRNYQIQSRGTKLS